MTIIFSGKVMLNFKLLCIIYLIITNDILILTYIQKNVNKITKFIQKIVVMHIKRL